MGEPQTAASAQQIVNDLGRKAKAAASILSQTSESQINNVLDSIAAKLRANVKPILEANEKDLAAGRQKGLSPALVDRLKLNPERIEGMAKGLEVVRALPDPVGAHFVGYHAA
jgi:glutamate-5-semialdehyde dehydrogenase